MERRVRIRDPEQQPCRCMIGRRWKRASFTPFITNGSPRSREPLNGGLLPNSYYALPEQVAAGFGPDVLTLQGGPLQTSREGDDPFVTGPATALRTRPQPRFTAQTDAEFYRRRKSSVVVRHVSGDRMVAMIEIVSPGNKSNRHALHAFVDKACELLEHRIHLLILDPFPPGPRDPGGIHAAIWEQIQDDPFQPPADQPLTLVAYECGHGHPGLSRMRGRRSDPAGDALVPRTGRLRHGAPRGNVRNRFRRHAPAMENRPHPCRAAGAVMGAAAQRKSLRRNRYSIPLSALVRIGINP